MSTNTVSSEVRLDSAGWSAYRNAWRWAALALVALAAIGLQRQLGADPDVHWLVDIAGRWLDGQTPYVDFIEINPPASILLYVPPTALARFLGLPADGVVQAGVALLVAAELAVAVVIARRAGLAEAFGVAGLMWSAAALLLLPGFVYGQRDHVALILAAPFFVTLTARASGRNVDALWAMVAGFGAGAMICVRPHYVLALAPAALYAAHRGGWRLSTWLSEITACGLVIALYLSVVALVFPQFFTVALPLDLLIYGRGARAAFLWAQPWFVMWLLLVLASWAARRSLAASTAAQLLGLASLGAMAVYFVLGKGWPYHLYVADALMLTSFAVANRNSLRRLNLSLPVLVFVLACASLALAFVFLSSGEKLFVVVDNGLSVACVLLVLRLALLTPDDFIAARHLDWTRLGVAVLGLAMGEMAMLQGAHSPLFSAAMSELGPRPKIALISSNGSYGLDLAAETGGIFAQRTYASYVVELATDRLKRGDASPATIAAMSDFIREDRDRLWTSIHDDRPDAIVVDPLWAQRYLDKPFMAALLDGYRLRATEKMPARFFPTPPLQLFMRVAAQ